jgi:hypothetical protein
MNFALAALLLFAGSALMIRLGFSKYCVCRSFGDSSFDAEEIYQTAMPKFFPFSWWLATALAVALQVGGAYQMLEAGADRNAAFGGTLLLIAGLGTLLLYHLLHADRLFNFAISVLRDSQED